MSYSTEGVVKEVIGLGGTKFKIKIEPIPNFSVKRGETTYVVWLEEEKKKKKDVLTSWAFESKSEYAFAKKVSAEALMTLQGKRVRLHAAAIPKARTAPTVTAIDVI